MNQEILPGCRLIRLQVKGDERGSLIAIEGGRDLPFTIARVYYVFDTAAGVDRGRHSHQHLHQMAIAVSGACTMVLDDGSKRVEVRLDDPTLGLTMGPMIWREMTDFTADCVLMVMADAPYDESDYIRDYNRFKAMVADHTE